MVHSGPTSPCNSDDEPKQKFIEKGTVCFSDQSPPPHRKASKAFILKPLPVKFKSRRFSKTVANDFGTVSARSSEWRRSNPAGQSRTLTNHRFSGFDADLCETNPDSL